MKKLTRAQARVLGAIQDLLNAGDVPPTYREIRSRLGFKSTATVRDHLRALERKGFVELGVGRFRCTRLVRATARAVRVPVLGCVVAGAPTTAHEVTGGFVEVPATWVRGDTFALRVVGESMSGAGLLDGDMAIMRRDIEPRCGQVVCATVDGETTLKTLVRRRGAAWLESAHPDYLPIRLTDDSVVQGVLVTSVRAYPAQETSKTLLSRAPKARASSGVADASR